MSVELIRPFGPSIAKVKIPKQLVDNINEYVDNIITNEEKAKRLSAGAKLAGDVTQVSPFQEGSEIAPSCHRAAPSASPPSSPRASSRPPPPVSPSAPSPARRSSPGRSTSGPAGRRRRPTNLKAFQRN